MFQQTRILLPIMLLVGLMLLVGVLPAGISAQGEPPLPTPTNVGGGGGSGGGRGGSGNGGDGGTPIPPKARVFGFVYDYSNAAYQSGVTVVIDGGGWQVETVTDSNGYYEIGNLGIGTGVVNLRLPPGTTPVVFDWPVRLGSGAELRVDLGYYWGEDPPIPVILSAAIRGNQLELQLENHTSETATGNMVEIMTPASLRVLAASQLSQGYIASYDSHQFQIAIDELEPDQTASAVVNLENVTAAVPGDQAGPTLRVMFTYDQQITPQVLELNPSLADADIVESVGAAALDLPQPQAVTSPGSAAPTAGQTPIQAQPQPVAPASTPTGQAQPVMPQSGAAQSSQNQPNAAKSVVPEPARVSPLPSTGSNLTSSGFTQIALPALLALTLGLAGWWSLRAKQ